MKSHLSHILPVAEACNILEEPTVRRIVSSFLSCRTSVVDRLEENDVVTALSFHQEQVPSSVQNAWNRYTKRTMGLDKLMLLKWMVPLNASPHGGPGGHLGLFDCLVHALSASANRTSSGGGVVSAPVVLLPDVLIALAICKEYAQVASNKNTKDENEYAIMMLSVLAFRVYDSYQKKGFVSRDTLHRFMTDVYGEESYKRPEVRAILDKVFTSPEEGGGTLSPLSGSQFCKGIAATLDGGVSHVLLDWLAKLLIRLIPPGELPPSTQAYLETIGSSHRSVERLCRDYGLAEARLYEIKRRFHSLVESSNIIHGDPMSADVQESRPRHVITEKAFCKAVSLSNSDMGHGGYLPESLAKLTFQAGCSNGTKEEEEPGQDENGEKQGSEGFWALFDVLQFGCHAVRRPIEARKEEDLDLLKFAFRVFGLLPGELRGHKVLTRTQVGHMILLLLEHSTFRLAADSPPSTELEEPELSPATEADFEQTMIESTDASLLAILPPDVKHTKVSLKSAIDYVMGDKDTLSFDAFCTWTSDVTFSQHRLGPYLLDLRMIAAILFGTPPSHASVEKMLVEEAQQRHKYRYPQTEVSRRGPRGTIWYILEDRWYRHWVTHVERVRGTDQDAADSRETSTALPRGLFRINNTGLLADNGSLALRADIRWRQDYEIIAPMAWSALHAWYDGGPPIHRNVVPYIPSTGAPSPHSPVPRIRTAYEIELYPYFVTVFLCDTLSRGEARPFQQYVPVSRVSPVRMLLLQLCKGLEIDPKYGRLWIMENNPNQVENFSDWLLNLDETIIEQLNRRGAPTGIGDNGQSLMLLLELKNTETEQWPRGLNGKIGAFPEGGRDGDLRPDSGVGDGIVGLYNMGNTCYLNSSIQCLSHTPIFRDYFTSKIYLHDINTTNPLGHEGRLAQVSAVLINSLWKSFNQSIVRPSKRVTAPGSYVQVNAPALTPKTFKESLGKFNDHFAGNEQHDAQELLAFLLGGLSEDLNRIVDKPYIEAPDSDGRPDKELADIWWSNHLKREMSIIVALFTGQYKSLLTCRSCKYESARFEPFSFLQLPLPEDDNIAASLILYPLRDREEPLKYTVRVRHNGQLLDVLLALAKVLHADKAAELSESEFSSTAKTAPNNDKGEEIDPELEAEYKELAINLAVVDMRDGYILKIAPNSWTLPDLQIKETGDLPLLHVYQMDPLPKGKTAVIDTIRQKVEASVPDSVEGEDVQQTEVSAGDTASEERSDTESERQEDGVDDETVDDDSEQGGSEPDGSHVGVNGAASNEFAHAKRIKPDSGHLLSNVEQKDSSQSPDCKFSFLALAQRRTERVADELLHPFAHRVFGTPLLLRVVDLEGYSGRDLYDLVAKRMRNFVPKSALRFLTDTKKDAPRDEEQQQGEEGEQQQGESSMIPRVGSRKRRHRTTSDMEEVAAGPVPRYGFRLRISSRDGRRCALCHWYECCIGCLVPDDDYPTIVMCGDSLVLDWHFAVDIATCGFGFRANNQESSTSQSPVRSKQMMVPVKNHSSCGDGGKKKGYAGAITLEDCLDAFSEEERIPEAYCSNCKDFRVQTKRMSLWRLPPVVIIQLKRFQFTQHTRRKLRDLVVFPIEGLDLSRIMADSKNGGKLPNNGNNSQTTTSDTTKESNGTNDDASLLYDLYGVVHHQGALSGGHYVASLKSELDGQWRLFNDAQIFEIHSRDVVDTSAYILFYIRRDAKEAKLGDFWEAREGHQGLTEEEMNKLIRGRSERCVIS